MGNTPVELYYGISNIPRGEVAGCKDEAPADQTYRISDQNQTRYIDGTYLIHSRDNISRWENLFEFHL